MPNSKSGTLEPATRWRMATSQSQEYMLKFWEEYLPARSPCVISPVRPNRICRRRCMASRWPSCRIELQHVVSPSSVANQIVVRGSLNATADATWGKTMQDLLARADATLQASAQPAQGGTATPINGVIHTRYAGRSGQLSFDQSYLRTQQTSVALNGTISDNAALQLRVNSNDLHELETIATAFRSPGSQPLGVYGHAALNATVSGSTPRSADLRATNCRQFPGSRHWMEASAGQCLCQPVPDPRRKWRARLCQSRTSDFQAGHGTTTVGADEVEPVPAATLCLPNQCG